MANHLSKEQRDELHFRVLRLLASRPELSQREMARELGISLGRINYCLKALVAMGHIKIENFRASRHKLGYLHVLTPAGLTQRAALASRFLRRKLAEFYALEKEILALESEVSLPQYDESQRLEL